MATGENGWRGGWKKERDSLHRPTAYAWRTTRGAGNEVDAATQAGLVLRRENYTTQTVGSGSPIRKPVFQGLTGSAVMPWNTSRDIAARSNRIDYLLAVQRYQPSLSKAVWEPSPPTRRAGSSPRAVRSPQHAQPVIRKPKPQHVLAPVRHLPFRQRKYWLCRNQPHHPHSSGEKLPAPSGHS